MFRKRPTEKPFGFFSAHIDTSMTHGHAKIFVPVSAMEGMSLGREETRPWNAGEFIVICICKQIPVTHMLGRHFVQNMVITGGSLGRESICPARTVRDARRDMGFKHLLIILKGGQGLDRKSVV